MCERVKEGLQKAGRGTGAGGMVSTPRGNPDKDAGDASLRRLQVCGLWTGKLADSHAAMPPAISPRDQIRCPVTYSRRSTIGSLRRSKPPGDDSSGAFSDFQPDEDQVSLDLFEVAKQYRGERTGETRAPRRKNWPVL